MPNFPSRYRAFAHLSVPLLLLFVCAGARAQFDPDMLPDMRTAFSQTGGMSKAASNSSGLIVPSIHPGETARSVGQLLEKYVQQKGTLSENSTSLSDKMPRLISELDAEFVKKGFAPRDFGVAVAYAVVLNYQAATDTQIADMPLQKVEKSLANTINNRWRTEYARLTPTAKEQLYETLLSQSFLVASFTKALARQNKTEEAARFRRNAAQLFTRLTGKSPSAVSFTDDGRIVGLGIGSTPVAETKPISSPTAKSLPIRHSSGKLRIAGVVLHTEAGGGVGGGTTVVFTPYILLADGRIGSAPHGDLDRWNQGDDQRKNPASWGTWQRSGKTLNIRWSNGTRSTWNYGGFYDAKPGSPAMKLTGWYKNVSGGGTAALGGGSTVFVQSGYTFAADGTFTNGTTAGGFDNSSTVSSTRRGKGSYRIDGWTITLIDANGKTERGLFYLFPDSGDSIGVLGTTFSKD